MLSSHAEVECKWALTAAGFERLRRRLIVDLGAVRPLDQHNRYYDSPSGLLRRARISLRLRLEGQRLHLTIKNRSEAPEPDLQICQERETWLNAALWPWVAEEGSRRLQHLLPLPADLRRSLAAEDLCCLGGFDNRRWHFSNEQGEDIALDATRFPGDQRDWECEVETDDPPATRRRWEALFRQLELPMRPQPATKARRYAIIRGLLRK